MFIQSTTSICLGENMVPKPSLQTKEAVAEWKQPGAVLGGRRVDAGDESMCQLGGYQRQVSGTGSCPHDHHR